MIVIHTLKQSDGLSDPNVLNSTKPRMTFIACVLIQIPIFSKDVEESFRDKTPNKAQLLCYNRLIQRTSIKVSLRA